MQRHLAILLAFTPLATYALDLTPVRSFHELEGFQIPVVRFADGAEQVAFQPPPDWNINGGGDLVSLCPKDRPDVLLQMRISAMKRADPTATEDLAAWCRRFLPPDATQTVLSGEAISPFTLRAQPSREFTFTYAASGRRLVTSVAVVDLSPQERLTVITTARSADFPTAREEVIRSLFTMNWSK
jgi:hypothetical protein